MNELIDHIKNEIQKNFMDGTFEIEGVYCQYCKDVEYGNECYKVYFACYHELITDTDSTPGCETFKIEIDSIIQYGENFNRVIYDNLSLIETINEIINDK